MKKTGIEGLFLFENIPSSDVPEENGLRKGQDVQYELKGGVVVRGQYIGTEGEYTYIHHSVVFTSEGEYKEFKQGIYGVENKKAKLFWD